MRRVKKIALIVIILVLILTLIIIKNTHYNKLDWDWEKECNAVFYMIKDKFHNEDSVNFPFVAMKNQDIPEKEENEKRILVVGDSYVFGYSDPNINNSWWKQLNLRIKEEGYSNVNVYAAGKYFFNTKDELETILKNDDLMKRIDPDLVIIGYVYNDAEERDATNRRNLIPDYYEIEEKDNKIYKENPTLYYELVDKMNSLGNDEYDKLKELGEILGFHRWDSRPLVLLDDGRLENYKNVLKEVDNRMLELNIPYFYLMLDNIDSPLIKKAYYKMYNVMNEMALKVYYEPFDIFEIFEKFNTNDYNIVRANPMDSHPGIIWTYDYGKKAYDILKNDYSFIFENAIIDDINKLELNINDTTPFLNINKKTKNVFEFEYPKKEKTKNEYKTKFLYYPINKNYVKLNLEYPKNVSKIKITGKNLKNVEVYVNTIDEEFGFDLNDAKRILTPCKLISKNTYKVNKKITSVNIHVDFWTEKDRNLEIEFVE